MLAQLFRAQLPSLGWNVALLAKRGDRLSSLEGKCTHGSDNRGKARPPSLFVTLHPDRWRELSPAERRDLVTQIGRIANGVGYSGAHVRTDGGPSVGQWLRKTGVQLWARPAGAT